MIQAEHFLQHGPLHFQANNIPDLQNEIAPGKRPLSSMVPTVVYKTDHACGLRMVIGAANGSRIITGKFSVEVKSLNFWI